MLVAALVIAVALAAAVGASRRARPAGAATGPAEGVGRTAPQWAVDAFGLETALELSGVYAGVVAEARQRLDQDLRDQAGFLSQVPVAAVRLLGAEDHDGVDGVVLQFAEGSELRASRLDVVPPQLVDHLVAPGASVRLSAVSLQGRHALVEVVVGARRFGLMARTVELEVPTRTDAERRRVLRRFQQ